MKYTSATRGEIYILRLYDGEIVHEEIEKFAKEKGIVAGRVQITGAIDIGSKLVMGPKEARSKVIVPIVKEIDNVYEATGTGTIFNDETGTPILHLHIAAGREGKTIGGCARAGVKVWHVMEVFIEELTNTCAIRKMDPNTGFTLLEPEP